MLPQSSQEKIHTEIKKRKLVTGYAHIILTSRIQQGIMYLLNHRYKDDFEPTKKVDKKLLDALSKFSLRMPPEYRITLPESVEAHATLIWPRVNREKICTIYDPRNIEITMPSENDSAKSFLWCVFLPARRNEGDVGYFVLSYPEYDRDNAEKFLTLVNRLFSEVKAGEKVIQIYGGSDIRLRGEHHWDDLVLTEEIKHSVKNDLEFWIASEKQFQKKHIPYRRGYLFEGPPGNGKTAVARTILSTYNFAAFGFNFSNHNLADNDLQVAFENAANAAPSVFLLEDIDRLFTDRMPYSHVTKEGLFNCLDGVATYSGVIVIATANHPEVLDVAIRHRPGRFDVPVRFSNPEYEQRLAFLQKLLGDPSEHSVADVVVASVADLCKGMSMAFMKLVYETAAAKMFKDGGNLIITSDALVRGFEQTQKYYKQMETIVDRKAGFTQRQNVEGGPPTCPEVAHNAEPLIEPTTIIRPTRHPLLD